MKIQVVILLVAVWYGSTFGYESTTDAPDGNELSPYIVQGQNAADGEHPYHVSLRESGEHKCSATILTRNYVVTAAHCVVQPVDNAGITILQYWRPISTALLSVRVGTIWLYSGGTDVRVSRSVIHPGFTITTGLHDIALLKLAKPLTFNNRVAPITIANAYPSRFASVIVSGWGTTDIEGVTMSQRLQSLATTVSDHSHCRYHTDLPNTNVICLESGRSSGICNGDSGAAAVYQNTLVGIALYALGDRCATEHPDGYTYVPTYLTWLQRNSDL